MVMNEDSSSPNANSRSYSETKMLLEDLWLSHANTWSLRSSTTRGGTQK